MFIIKTAIRYVFSKVKGHRISSIMIIIGIAASIMAVIVSSSVMNSLQNSQLDNLRNIESFDIIVKGSVEADLLRSISGVDSVFKFTESAAVVENKDSGNSISCRIRGMESSFFNDVRIKNSLVLISGLPPVDNNIVVPYPIRSALQILPDDNLSITILKKGKTARIVPYKFNCKSCGIYSSALQEFDSSTIFMDVDSINNISNLDDIQYGLYVHGNINTITDEIKEMYPDVFIQTWQEYNRALYSALMLEKTMMYIFLGFMFLIVCANIKNSTLRLIKSKQTEGAILRAIGCTRNNTICIFIAHGLIISLIGIFAGVIAGVVVINNLGLILSVVDKVSIFFTKKQTVFSFLRIDADISLTEIMLICCSVLILSFLFTLSACKKLYRKEILEVISNVSD